MTKRKKRKAYFYGLYAEILTVVFLTLKGYRILKWRYKTPVGEIDILAKKKNALIVVEVKARRTLDTAKESVTLKMQKRIIRAAEYYINRHPECMDMDIRFDLMAIGGFFSAQHLDNAWRPAS